MAKAHKLAIVRRALGLHEGPEEMVARTHRQILLLLGLLLVFTQGSALAPFIYTLF